MKNPVAEAITSALASMLRPLVRILLRYGIPYGAFADVAKRVYVDVATDEFSIPGRKQSKSRVSVLTGLSRKEVLRVNRLILSHDAVAVERYNRAARVVSGWVRERRYTDENGTPLTLPMEGDGPTFAELVKSFSGDAPARAVLDELVRVGAVEFLADGRVRLIGRSYVPRTGEIDKFGILGTDAAALISTIDHNIRNPSEAFFQRKVSYDNLPSEVLPELKDMTSEKAQDLLELFDRWMSERDRDVNPEVRGTGRKRAGIGIYYFEEDHDGEAET